MKYQLVKIAQLGVGKMFGEVDVVKKQTYTNTIKCFSTTGRILRIRAEDFIQVIKVVDKYTLK